MTAFIPLHSSFTANTKSLLPNPTTTSSSTPRRLPQNAPSKRCLALRAMTDDAVDTAPSEFSRKFGSLRGQNVEPVSTAVSKFTNAFKRPVPIVYRSIINEMITTTHLAKVCAMWRFDAIFAYGFDQIFAEFLRYYPDTEERDNLYKCTAESLGFDVNNIRETAASVSDWIDGKTEDEIFSALAAASPGASVQSVGPVIEAAAYIRDAGDFEWYYSRLFGIGLIQIMSKVGVELTIGSAETWAEKIGIEKSKMAAEMGSYLSSMERLKQAEQIFAEAAAREAKKTAERLAEKAKAAVKEAEELEKSEEVAVDETNVDVVAESA